MEKKLLDWQGVAERCGGISKSLVDDLDSKNLLGPVIQHGDGKNSKRFWQESEVEAYLKRRENLNQEALEKLKKMKLDPDKYPETAYINYLQRTREFTSFIRTLITGDEVWYQQKNIVTNANKCLAKTEFAFGLFGRMEYNKVIDISDTIRGRIISLLGDGPQDKKIYPCVASSRTLYGIQNHISIGSFLEMNHEFFNLGDDQQVEVKNTSKKDILYSSEVFGFKSDNHLRYRIPAEGGWVSIPPFAPDTRPDSGTPGRFVSAIDLFEHRGDLKIRIVKKSSSRPPMCMADELEKNAVAEIDKTTEIDALIEIIKGE